ncbi:HipA family kinase [Pseudoxanthomonas kaohsiungensis]|uniref:HipA family kinase n=1 Tax=Pseudoxanthomonas kaohsiungensis TaxID=283923 RepID=A0ABW3LZV1_9GAMM|nr:HipA family kinase [Pseudoxanthomonas kaohsiungensis]KAF1703234.1 aminotransferase class I and II [Pseudoxanthomonas kaohsiungensis]
MSLRRLCATRYVTPLREGGSMPAVVEGDDQGLYVLKFRGAGQGPKALVAEAISGGLARALELPMPEIVLMDLDAELARTEGDPEIQDLIKASAGLNLGMDYLPGAMNFDPVAEQPDPELASRIVWFDAFTSNVDRTARNPNMLVWHGRLYLIDHGASLYFHHGWDGDTKQAGKPFALVRDHVLLRWADRIADVDPDMASRLPEAVVADIVGQVPDEWLQGPDAFADPATQRAAYVAYLCQRLAAREGFVQEAIRARA